MGISRKLQLLSDVDTLEMDNSGKTGVLTPAPAKGQVPYTSSNLSVATEDVTQDAECVLTRTVKNMWMQKHGSRRRQLEH